MRSTVLRSAKQSAPRSRKQDFTTRRWTSMRVSWRRPEMTTWRKAWPTIARPRAGVLESSWRVRGATGAEVAAVAALRDPSAQVVEVAHVEEFGADKLPPEDAIVHFQGDDPESGPVLRYTIVKAVRRA